MVKLSIYDDLDLDYKSTQGYAFTKNMSNKNDSNNSNNKKKSISRLSLISNKKSRQKFH